MFRHRVIIRITRLRKGLKDVKLIMFLSEPLGRVLTAPIRVKNLRLCFSVVYSDF